MSVAFPEKQFLRLRSPVLVVYLGIDPRKYTWSLEGSTQGVFTHKLPLWGTGTPSSWRLLLRVIMLEWCYLLIPTCGFHPWEDWANSFRPDKAYQRMGERGVLEGIYIAIAGEHRVGSHVLEVGENSSCLWLNFHLPKLENLCQLLLITQWNIFVLSCLYLICGNDTCPLLTMWGIYHFPHYIFVS